ncbi:MAG: germination protein [Paenibacillus sp.]|jgi:Na+/alanine symporter|nr:germination protein [Paenibacillus sp.]
MENALLSGWQMFTLTYTIVVGTTYILLPGKLMADAKQYAWLVCVWATLYGLVLAGAWLYLSKHYPGKSLVRISTEVLGKWAGGFVALFYTFFFIQIASWVTRNLSDFMHANFMPRTPISVFNILTLLVCAYAVVKGIQSIAMVCELMNPYMVFAFWLPFSFMLVHPIFTIFREMQFSRFLEHLEVIISINILIIVCLKLSILFYCAVMGICRLFKIEKRATVAFPLVWVISAYSLLFANVVENVDWVQKYLFNYYLLFSIIIPFILMILTWLRNKPKVLTTA